MNVDNFTINDFCSLGGDTGKATVEMIKNNPSSTCFRRLPLGGSNIVAGMTSTVVFVNNINNNKLQQQQRLSNDIATIIEVS